MQMKKYLSYLGLCLAFLLYGCNEDDVFEIFANGQTWYWSSSYDTTNWEDDNKWDMTLSIDDVARINSTKDSYYVRFSDDGTVEGKDGEQMERIIVFLSISSRTARQADSTKRFSMK